MSRRRRRKRDPWKGTIDPIATKFNGDNFRSRLEARWALIFKDLGIQAEYEPFTLRGKKVGYLPDFHIHNVDFLPHSYGEVTGPLQLEIKHRQYEPTERDGKKWKLALAHSPALIVAYGIGLHDGTGKFGDDDLVLAAYDDALKPYYPLAFYKCIQCHHQWIDVFHNFEGPYSSCPICHSRGQTHDFDAAYQRAINYRFDYRFAS